MSKLFKRLCSACKDLKGLKEVATQVAGLTSSTVLENNWIIIEPSFHPFIVPIPARNYKIEFFIGEADSLLLGKIRKNDLEVDAAFAVTFLDQVGLTRKLDAVSERLGVEVYGSLMFSEREILERLLTPNLETLLRRLNFTAISKFSFSPLQMELRCSETEAGARASLALLGRDLLLTSYEETRRRSRD